MLVSGGGTCTGTARGGSETHPVATANVTNTLPRQPTRGEILLHIMMWVPLIPEVSRNSMRNVVLHGCAGRIGGNRGVFSASGVRSEEKYLYSSARRLGIPTVAPCWLEILG